MRAKDRILFNNHGNICEGVVLEVSPSGKHINLKYVYMGAVLERWEKKGVLIEVLTDTKA